MSNLLFKVQYEVEIELDCSPEDEDEHRVDILSDLEAQDLLTEFLYQKPVVKWVATYDCEVKEIPHPVPVCERLQRDIRLAKAKERKENDS